MTIADWCILGAVLLYLLTLAPIKAMGHRDFENSARAMRRSANRPFAR